MTVRKQFALEMMRLWMKVYLKLSQNSWKKTKFPINGKKVSFTTVGCLHVYNLVVIHDLTFFASMTHVSFR